MTSIGWCSQCFFIFINNIQTSYMRNITDCVKQASNFRFPHVLNEYLGAKIVSSKIKATNVNLQEIIKRRDKTPWRTCWLESHWRKRMYANKLCFSKFFYYELWPKQLVCLKRKECLICVCLLPIIWLWLEQMGCVKHAKYRKHVLSLHKFQRHLIRCLGHKIFNYSTCHVWIVWITRCWLV